MKVLFSRKKKKYEEDDAYLPMEENEQGEEMGEAEDDLAPEEPSKKRKGPRRQASDGGSCPGVGVSGLLKLAVRWQSGSNRGQCLIG